MIKTQMRTVLLMILAGMMSVSYAQQTTVKDEIGEVKLTLDFKDAPISTIMDYISESTGLVIISNYQLSGRISIISKKPVGVDAAISLINSVMKENGYAVVKTGNILKIVQLSEAKMMNIPVRSGSDPKTIEESDEVITHIIPIVFADAVKLKDDLSGLLPEYAEFTANEASNSLIITDTSANIKRISKIVEALDTQMAKVAEIRVFHLVYADAENVSNLINELFEEDNQSEDQNPISRMFSRGGPPGFGRFGGRGRGDDDNNNNSKSGSSASRVVAADDEMTNAVVVSGPSDTLEVIAKMITELDSNPDEERKLYVYSLKNGDAENIKELLNSLFSELQAINEDNTSGFGGAGVRGGNVRTQPSSGSSSSSDDISDETYIEADTDTNSLIILTSNKNYDKIKSVIDELDKPIPQVLIKVLIAELTVTDDFDLGMELSYTDTNRNGDTVTTATNFLPEVSGQGITTDYLTGDLTAKLYALQQDGKLNVLSRPYILTSNNQPASINVGQEVPFITDSTYTETGQTVNTIEYDDIGIMLDVTPYINPDGLVIMDIQPEISTISDDTIQLTENVNATIFTKRSSSSKVAVRNGQTIVIGGLMQDTETETIKKVPILGDIPLLGLLFQRKETSKDKTELLIFLTPQVADSADMLEHISDFEQTKSKLLKDQKEDSLLNEHIDNMRKVVVPE